jgi:hypothetical protein
MTDTIPCPYPPAEPQTYRTALGALAACLPLPPLGPVYETLPADLTWLDEPEAAE